MAEIVRIHPERKRRLPEPLWREVLGKRLRALRERQGATLSETASRAGISPQYLSEIERGRKEPSSEMISAVAGALGATLIDLTVQVSDDLRRRGVAESARSSIQTTSSQQASAPSTGQFTLALAA